MEKKLLRDRIRIFYVVNGKKPLRDRIRVCFLLVKRMSPKIPKTVEIVLRLSYNQIYCGISGL